MDFRKKMKGFFTLTRRANGGFTLVELIVVIAILAILAGVGIPVYSGYITKANEQADRTLIGDVMRALEMQYYLSADSLTGPATVVLTDVGATATGFAEEAMIAAFGAGYTTSATLKHDAWGNGVLATQTVLNHFVNGANATGDHEILKDIYNGNAEIGLVEDIDTLFEQIEAVSKEAAGESVDGESYGGSGAEIVQLAATQTLNYKPVDFADKWKSQSAYTSDSADIMTSSVERAAVIKARNTALAKYLAGKGFPIDASKLAGLIQPGADMFPEDFTAIWQTKTTTAARNEYLREKNIIVNDLPNAEMIKFNKAINLYFTDATSNGKSAAYNDALAYYAMMETVSAVKDATGTKDDATYWNEMADAVNKYGQIASGQTTVAELQNQYNQLTITGSSVSVMVTISPDGENGYVIEVSPATAKP